MRDGASRALLVAFAVSILLHAALFGALPRLRELSAIEPPEPLPLIARVERPAPPPRQQVAAPPVRKLAPQPGPPKPAPSIEAPKPEPEPPREATPAPEPAPAAEQSAPVAPPAAPAPAPARAPVILASPAPAPAPTIDPQSVDRFRRGLVGQAARYKRYPRVAIDNNWQGEVVVRMSIGADGRIVALAVARGSGHEVLDRQALEMFRNAKPLVPIPEALRGRAFELELRAVYRLGDQRSG